MQRPGRYPALTAGTVLILVGIGFKLAVVPFHMWAPDVYEGEPAPVAGLVATVSKGAAFAFLLRYFMEPGLADGSVLAVIFTGVAVLSDVRGKPAGPFPGQRETAPGLLVHCPHGLSPCCLPGIRASPGE